MAKRRDFVELYDTIEQTGFIFNPLITYSGSYFLKTGSLNGNINLYDENQDIFILNSKVDNGVNRYREFVRVNFVNKFGNPPANAIMPTITPILLSEMIPDGSGRRVRFTYSPTLFLLLENPDLIIGAPEEEDKLALYVKDQIKIKRDKMLKVLREWDNSPYYEEMKNRYENHGYKLTPEFLKKQADFFTSLMMLLKDVSKSASKTDFDKDKFIDCFDKNKLILMLCKCVVDSTKTTIELEDTFHNCFVEVLQIINNIKEIGIEKEFNPSIRYYNEETGRIEKYTYLDLQKEVARILSEHPEFVITSFSMDSVVDKGLVHNEEATREFSKILLDDAKRKTLESNWEFIKPGEKEFEETEDKISSKISKRVYNVSGKEKDAYLELMRKKLFFEKTGYDELIVGINSFAGYVGYIYNNGIVIFERMYEDSSMSVPVSQSNATYVMNIDNFVKMSSLSKTEIIQYIKRTDNPDVRRIYHTDTWEQRCLSAIEGKNYDNVKGKIDELIRVGKLRKTETQEKRKGKN